MNKSANDFEEHINTYSKTNNDLAKNNKTFFREFSKRQIYKTNETIRKLDKLTGELENNMPIEEAIKKM